MTMLQLRSIRDPSCGLGGKHPTQRLLSKPQVAKAGTVHVAQCLPSAQQHPGDEQHVPAQSTSTQSVGSSMFSRRELIGAGTVAMGLLSLPQPASADDFTTTSSGLKYLDIRKGEGPQPQLGDLCEVHWSGYTKGYQGKRIDNTSVRDEPYSFKLGSHQAIAAFEEAVAGMHVGGIRRIEVPGSRQELSYPRNRQERFTNELITSDLKLYKYRYGPQPVELGGQRALDFILDNNTLQDFNRTLLFDIKLLSVRKAA